MKTLEELKEERDVLTKMKSESLKKRLEAQKLKREIRELKYPGTTTAFRSIKKGGVAGFKTIGSGARNFLSEQLKLGAEEKKKQQESERKKMQTTVKRELMKKFKKKTVKKPVKRRKKR